MSSSTVPDQEWIDYLKTIDTPTLSNAIEKLKLRPDNEGFASLHTRCFFPEFGRMVGYAVTAHVETMTKEKGDRGQFVRLFEAVAASPQPTVVVFQEIGPQPEYAAHSGEVMATTFKRLGAVGLVSDSAVRDIPEVRAMRFHYFARGTVASHGYFRIVRVGIPVQVGGLPVRTGDLLHGDENGLIVVPAGAREGVAEAVEAVRLQEGELMEFIRGSSFEFEGLRKRFLH
jgi:regulator of RNase E activity RraA